MVLQLHKHRDDHGDRAQHLHDQLVGERRHCRSYLQLGSIDIFSKPCQSEQLRILTRLRRDAVTVAWGLAGDQHADRVGAVVDCLVPLAGRDF
jgi:hypothetical protein